MVIAPGQQGLASGRAQGGGMKTGVFETLTCQPFGGGGVDRAAKGAGGAKTHIVQQDDEHVRRALRRPQRLKFREAGVRVFGGKGGQAHVGRVWDG